MDDEPNSEVIIHRRIWSTMAKRDELERKRAEQQAGQA